MVKPQRCCGRLHRNVAEARNAVNWAAKMAAGGKRPRVAAELPTLKARLAEAEKILTDHLAEHERGQDLGYPHSPS